MTIPASASEVYDISEVGVCSPIWYDGREHDILITHALILDSEGNPITVKKMPAESTSINISVDSASVVQSQIGESPI